MKETIKVNTLPLEKAGDYMTGTIFEEPNGSLWRVYRGPKGSVGFKRMTKADGTLLKGEERWR